MQKDNSDQELEINKIIEALGTPPEAEPSDFIKEVEAGSRKAETLAEQENTRIIAMRDRWSNWVLFFIGVIVVFDIILVSLYGFGIWDFKDSRVVMVVITENFLKIIGLGMLITHSIFKKIYQ